MSDKTGGSYFDIFVSLINEVGNEKLLQDGAVDWLLGVLVNLLTYC